MRYIVEHLEKELYPWSLIEYEHIAKIVGKNNLIITNIKKQDIKKLNKFCITKTESVLNLNLGNACLLDPKAKKELTPEEAKNFNYFILGGILGDFPEQGRTKKYLTSKLKNVKVRNLTDKQMSTDTAVLVTKLVVDGKKLNEIEFIDSPRIILKRGLFCEEINLPYRYVIKNDKPIISSSLIKYLREKKDL